MSGITGYHLSATLSGHEDDVRCVISPSADLIISSSRDGTVRYWNRQAPNEWGVSTVNYQSEGFINCLAWVSLDSFSQYIVSGGADAIVNLTGLKPSAEPDYALIGHKSNVSSLDTYENMIISGSWDSTAKVWKDQSLLYDLKGHENSVWGVKILSPHEFITCSADRTIRKWSNDKQIGVYEGHTDVVRDVIVLSNGNIASCSNDGTIKIWNNTNYKCIMTLKGHESFIYSLTQLSNGNLVSCGEDRTVRVWKDFKCIQVITFPCQTVWNVNKLYGTNDIIASSDDGKIRIFSTDANEKINPDELRNYEEELSNFSINVDSIPGFNKESLLSVDVLTQRVENNYEGELLYAKSHYGTLEAFRWSVYGNKWYKVGNIIEGSSSSKKKEYLGKMYDFVMDVDIQDGAPPLKLAFNANDNAYTVADEFLSVNELPASFREEVVQFILQNTGALNITETEQSASTATDQDLYNSRVYNPYMTTSSAPKSGMPPLVILPQREYLTLKDIDITKVFTGLEKINKTQGSDVQLTDDDITSFLKSIETNNTETSLEYTTHIIKNWTNSGKLVGFDLLRYLIIELKVPRDDLIDIFKIGLNSSDAPKTVLVVLRCLCNMFINSKWGEMMLNDPDVLGILFNETVLNLAKTDKLTSVTATTLLLNFSVLMVKFGSVGFLKPLLDLIDILAKDSNSMVLSNSESCYRLLIAYGTTSYIKKGPSTNVSWLSTVENRFKGESRFGSVIKEIKSLNK